MTKQILIFIFITGIVLLLSTSVMVHISFRDISESISLEYDSHERSELLESIQYEIVKAESSRRGYFISNDKQYLYSYNESKEKIDSIFKISSKVITPGTAQADNFKELKSLLSERILNMDEGIELQESKGNNPQIHKSLMDKGKIINTSLRSLLKKMIDEEYHNMRSKVEGTEQKFLFAKYSVLAGIGLSCIIFISLFVLLIKKTAKVFESESQEISREELEAIVKERTAEISQINKKLYTKVDELQKMENALKQSEEYYKMLFEQAHDAILIFDPNGEIVLDVNNRACEIYGFKREEFIGLSLKLISKNIPQGEENLRNTLAKGYFHNFQTVHYNKNMSEILMEINASVIQYKGKPAILSLNRDITERVLAITQ